MKHLFLLVSVVLLSSITLYGQIQKGVVRLGGSLSGDFSDNGSNLGSLYGQGANVGIFSFEIAPNAGVFITDKWLLGGSISYRWYDMSSNAFSSNNSGNFSISPYACYHKKISEKLFLLFNYSIDAGIYKSKDFYLATERTNTNWSVATYASPGFLYFLSDKLSLKTTIGSLGYRYTHYTEDYSTGSTNSSDNNYIGINASGNLLSFGVDYYID